jgi:hypothetical protein
MRSLVVALCLSVGLVSAAQAHPGKCHGLACVKAAAAPEIGSGISAAIAIGGYCLGRRS